ncbi:hypothetical protein H5410_008225 [Solanum commersonii]|uniref:Uncharacterized protein n=1 Tax=Solanum commersonii TaxID=4109 RepID=A0A9J6AG76_SOLCO|nr:hypothetical protein H5410_008225 [Solanum commersonii]
MMMSHIDRGCLDEIGGLPPSFVIRKSHLDLKNALRVQKCISAETNDVRDAMWALGAIKLGTEVIRKGGSGLRGWTSAENETALPDIEEDRPDAPSEEGRQYVYRKLISVNTSKI